VGRGGHRHGHRRGTVFPRHCDDRDFPRRPRAARLALPPLPLARLRFRERRAETARRPLTGRKRQDAMPALTHGAICNAPCDSHSYSYDLFYRIQPKQLFFTQLEMKPNRSLAIKSLQYITG